MRWRSSVVLALVTGLLGFLLVTAGISARDAQRAAVPRKTQLANLIGQRRSQEADLELAVRQLRLQVVDAQRRQVSTSQSQRDETDREALLAIQAGTTAMKGDSVIVTLSDSSRQPPTSDPAGAYRIHDSDLQLVVNGLLAAGAEAVAVNDNRIVATSPIRNAGGTIVVNFRPLSAPYRVVGIGADRRKFEDSDIARRFDQWTTRYGLGFGVSTGQATVAAYAGRVDISSAKPVSPPTVATPPTGAGGPPAPTSDVVPKKGQ